MFINFEKKKKIENFQLLFASSSDQFYFINVVCIFFDNANKVYSDYIRMQIEAIELAFTIYCTVAC